MHNYICILYYVAQQIHVVYAHGPEAFRELKHTISNYAMLSFAKYFNILFYLSVNVNCMVCHLIDNRSIKYIGLYRSINYSLSNIYVQLITVPSSEWNGSTELDIQWYKYGFILMILQLLCHTPVLWIGFVIRANKDLVSHHMAINIIHMCNLPLNWQSPNPCHHASCLHKRRRSPHRLR